MKLILTGARLMSVCVVLAGLYGCTTLIRDSSVKADHSAHLRTSAQRVAVLLRPDQARAYARLTVPFARTASETYCNYLQNTNTYRLEDCANQAQLAQTNWLHLFDSSTSLTEAEQKKYDFGSTSVVTAEEHRKGLEFMAHARARPDGIGEIIISFRGTDFSSWHDWRSNLRWVTRALPGTDQYDVVYGKASALVALALGRAQGKLPSIQRFDVFTSGHSLGGGLAQLLAYSDQRIKGAVVFDPSPVTGYFNLVSDSQVNCNARILRVYEQGEALQYVRSLIRQFYNLSANINEVSYDLLHYRGNPVLNHSMTAFRKELEITSDTPEGAPVSTTAELPGAPDCDCFRNRKKDARTEWPTSCPRGE